MMKKAFQALRENLATLRNSEDRVKETFASIIHDGEDDEYVTELEEDIGSIINPTMREVLSSCSGYSLGWKILNHETPGRILEANSDFETLITGEFTGVRVFEGNEVTVVEVLPAGVNVPGFDDYFVLEDLYFGTAVLLGLAENDSANKLFLFQYPDQFFPLRVSLQEYYELLSNTIGLIGWQEYILEDISLLKPTISNYFHSEVLRIAPTIDLSKFSPQLPEVESGVSRFLRAETHIDYRLLFTEMIERLKQVSGVKIIPFFDKINNSHESWMGFGVNIQTLRKVERDYKREISTQMLEFFYQMNGCRVTWEWTNPDDENDIQYGLINIQPLEQALGGKGQRFNRENWSSKDLHRIEDSVYGFNEEEQQDYPEMAKFLESARLFEEQGDMFDYFLSFKKGEDEPILYKTQETEFFPLSIDFRAFMTLKFETLGMKGWESAFTVTKDELELKRFQGQHRTFNEEFEKVFASSGHQLPSQLAIKKP
jgi:hypothetical protein